MREGEEYRDGEDVNEDDQSATDMEERRIDSRSHLGLPVLVSTNGTVDAPHQDMTSRDASPLEVPRPALCVQGQLELDKPLSIREIRVFALAGSS